jgi:hypothetical protein
LHAAGFSRADDLTGAGCNFDRCIGLRVRKETDGTHERHKR